MIPLEQRIKDQARKLGFDLVGIAPATPADSFDRLRDWLDHGFAGEMSYMHRHADARREPASILPEVRSVVMVAMQYAASISASGGRELPSGGRQPSENSRGGLTPARPHIARYALGSDYHDVLRDRLKQLLQWIEQQAPGCRGRAVVDTAPLLERDFARRAGLGWFGKNTMLLNKHQGSYFFLAGLLLDIELATDAPHETGHCGTCTACLDACPTEAFVAPGILDSRRCISYLTIELRGSIPEDLRRPMGSWLFGCDICQEVCPWNRKAPLVREPAFQGRDDLLSIDPVELLGLSTEEFRQRFRGTALMRTGRTGLLRNAAIVLGNRGDPAALPALRRAAADSDPVIRGAAAWAIEQIVASTVVF
jgi:epoxyqueuosine reductase